MAFRRPHRSWIILPLLVGGLAGSLAYGQLTIQSNPVFSTPVPGEQKLGPAQKPFAGDDLETGPLEIPSDNLEEEAPPENGTILETVPLVPSPPEPGPLPPAETEAPLLQDIHLEGNRYFRTWAIRRHLRPILRQQGKPLDPAGLRREIQAINRFAPFKLKGTLEPVENGDIALRLDVYEQQPWQIVGTFDNQGRPGIGYYRGGAQIVNHNLLGFGDALGVQYVGSEGAQRLVAEYKIPLNARGGEFNFQYIFHDLDYDQRLLPPGVSNLEGRDHAWILILAQPIDRARRFTPYISTLFREVTIESNGVEIVSANPRPWTLGLRYADTDKYGLTNVDLQPVIVGQHWFGGDAKFYRARITFLRTLKLPHDNLLVFRGAGQVSGDELPPVQAIQVGGEYSVRGYTEGLLTGDRGYFFSVEHQWPIPFLAKASPRLANRMRGVGFLDYGQAWVDKSNARYVGGVSPKFERTALMSVGLGLRYNLTQYAQGFVDAGWGLFDRNRIELLSQPTVRIHFGVRSELLPRPFRKRGKRQYPL